MTKISQNQFDLFKLNENQETKKGTGQANVQNNDSIFGKKTHGGSGSSPAGMPGNLFDIIDNNIGIDNPEDINGNVEIPSFPTPHGPITGTGGSGSTSGSEGAHGGSGSASGTGSPKSLDLPEAVSLTGEESLDELKEGRQQSVDNLRQANMRGTKNEFLADSKKDVDDKKKAYDEAVDNLSSEDEEVQAQIDDIRQRKAENDEAVSTKETEKEALEEMSDEMKDNMYQIEDEISATQDEADEVSANIEDKEATIEDLEGQLSSLQEPNQSDYMTTDEEGNEVVDYEAYGAAVAEYERQKAELEEQIQAAKDELNKLQEQLDELTQQIEKLEYEKEYMEQELAELEEQIATAEEELDALKEEADAIEEELAKLIEEDSENKIQGKEEVMEAMAAFDAAKETFSLTEDMYDSYNALQKNVLEENINTYDKAIEKAKEAEKEEEKEQEDENEGSNGGGLGSAPNHNILQEQINRKNKEYYNTLSVSYD